jgi:hypothetical protein
MSLEKNARNRLFLFGIYCLILCTTLFIYGCDTKPQAEKPAAENATKRVPFDQLFEVNGNNVKPKTIIRYNGTTFTPESPFEIQVMSINSEPFAQLIGRDAEVKNEGGVTTVIKFH